ncbi:hypothetical protein CJU90_4464 [Yarrowia sp. C11]|nr:hypothetical protein CKK34_6745 [Yarrowia sp. E02]KAG5365386.1 hypothetical protein CJU90_4464 [Yarrowia sp. C11]
MTTTPPRLPQLQGLTPLRFSPYRRSGCSPRSKRLSSYRREAQKLPSHKAGQTLPASTSLDSLASTLSVTVSADVIYQDLRQSEVNYLEELQLLIQSDLSPRMTSVVRKLKLLHDNMPIDGFFNWARDVTPLYSSYIAEYTIDATTATHMLYLLKRPLVRIRYLAKVLKKLAESSPEFESRRETAIRFRDLTRQARDKAESERERVDLTTFNFDRVVHFDTLQETYDEFDYTTTLHRDYFEMCVKHRSGKTFDKKMVEVFLVTDTTTPNKGMPSNKISADAFTDTFSGLAICSLEDPGRSLIFPQFKRSDFVLVEQPKSRLSSRQAKYEIVLQASNHSTVVLYCPELDQVKLWSRVLGHLFGHVTDYSASKASSDLLKLTFGREYSFGIESSRILAGPGGLGINIKEEAEEKPVEKKLVDKPLPRDLKNVPRLESSLSLGDSLFGESLDKFKYDKPVEALNVVKKVEVAEATEAEVPPAPTEAAPAPPNKPSFAAAALVVSDVVKSETGKPVIKIIAEAPSQSTSMESFTSEIMDRGSSDSSWSELEEEDLEEVEEVEETKPLVRDESSVDLPIIEPKESSSPASTLRPISAYETASDSTPNEPNFPPRPRDNSAAIATRRGAAATSLVEARATGPNRDALNKSSSVIGGNQYENMTSFTANATPGGTKPLPFNSAAMLRSNHKFVPAEGAQSKFSPELEQGGGFKFGKKWWSRGPKTKEAKEAKKQEKEMKRLEKEAVKERERLWYENNKKEKEDRLEELKREKEKAQVVEEAVPEHTPGTKSRSAFAALKTVSQLVKAKPPTFEPTFQMVEPKTEYSASPSSLSSCSIDTPRMSALLPSPLVMQNAARNEHATVEQNKGFNAMSAERVDGFEMISPTQGSMTAPLPQVPKMSTAAPPVPPVPSVEVQAPTPVLASIPVVATISAAFASVPVSAPPVPKTNPYTMDNSSVATITASTVDVATEASTSTSSFVTAPEVSPPKKVAPPPPPSRRQNSVSSAASSASIKSDLQAMSRSLNESLSRSASQTMSTSSSNSTIASLASEEKELLRSGSVHASGEPSKQLDKPSRSPSLSHHLRSVKSMDSLPSTISSKSISSMGREDSGFSFLEPGFFGNPELKDHDSDSDSDADSVHLLDTPEIEQLEMTQVKAKAVMVGSKLPSEPSDSSISSKRSIASGTSATSVTSASSSKNSIRFTPLRNAKSEEMLLKSGPLAGSSASSTSSSEESEESDTLAPLVKVKQRVSRVGSPAECLAAPATVVAAPTDGTTIFTVNAFTSRWKGNTWETLSDSMLSLKVCIGTEGGRLDVGSNSILLNKQSALRRGTAVDVQLRQSTDIYSFRLRNSREADGLLSACNSAKKDLVERSLISNRSSYTASICSDSSLGTVGSGSGPLSLKPRNKLSLLAQDEGLLLLQNLKARLFLSPRMSKLWLGLGVGLVTVNVSTEDLMTNAKTVTMKQQGFGEAVFSGSLPAQAFAKDGNGIRVYADYEQLGHDAMSQRDLSSNVYYLQLKGEKEVDRVFEIFTTS